MANNKSILTQKLKQIITLANDCLAGISDKHIPEHKQLSGIHATEPQQIKYNMSASAFMKKHSTKNMNGPKKFVLLLAYLAKGDVNQNIELNKIEKTWNKMNRILKKHYNRSDSIVARDNGWVDTRKHGQYYLRDSWQEIFA